MDNTIRQRSRPILSAGASSNNSIFADDDFCKKKSQPLISYKGWLLIFSVYLTVFLAVFYCDVIRFPSPVSVESLKNIVEPRSLQFSEERARNFVVELSSIGPKPTGSYENEVVAVDYITRQLNYVKHHINPANKLDIDLQITSGCFPLTFKDGMMSCYEDVKNIIARIGPLKSTNKSLLINCHYDSVPTSPGSSDDIVSCAVMLEVLLSLSQHSEALPNEVIFLFNGAEENILQAAHGFITQHPWAKSVVGFVNLEACGAGGKQMLFQADPERTWLLQSYASGAPFPQGSVIAQDIFKSGLIPSDTDYRVFKHFGNLPGLDFAYVKNGYVYHTKFDVPEAINAGAIQQAGLNLLNLIHNALKSPDMRNVEEQTKLQLVFFDFMGIFMVVYRIGFATVLNALLIPASIVDMFLRNKDSGVSMRTKIFLIVKALFVMLGTLIAACLGTGLIAKILDVFGATMSWYRSPYLVVGLYGCSSLAIILSIHWFLASKIKNQREKWLQEDVCFDAARLIWVLMLITLELTKINSNFICFAWAFFPTLIRSVLGQIFNLTNSRGTRESHLVTHVLMQIIPLLLLFYCVWSMYSVFIPITGRIGAMVNPDLLVGLFTAILVFLSTSYMFTLVYVSTSVRRVVVLLSSIFVVTFFLVCFTSLGFPYSGDPSAPTPMRCYILHTQRTFHNRTGHVASQDSGYWVVPLDYNGPRMLGQFMEQIKEEEPIDCDAELGCGMPFYMPVISLLRKSYYVPASKPKIHGHHAFEMISKTLARPNVYRLTFRANGPDHMTIVLSPQLGVELIDSSLTKEPPLESLKWVDRKTYFIYYSYGEYKKPWTFSIDLQVSPRYPSDAPLLDVSFSTHYLHGHDSITGDFPALLQQIPSWIHATPWTCTLDMFVF